MDRIEKFLDEHGLGLADCHPDWADLVKEYNGIKSALPESVREEKERAILKTFTDFHIIEIEKPKKPAKEKKKKGDQPATTGHQVDDKSLLSRADDMVDLLE